ncbi:MAG TPA: GNAT family N-acetyltransferase [Polyangia bacterium]|nr:GNAT family N-acetyltransferase [Polyangia bacterium]
MEDAAPIPLTALDLRAARTDAADVLEVVRAITRAAFLVNPETGLRIDGDTPPELPMVEALLARGVAERLHVAVLEGEVVAYVLYTRGALSSDPEARVLGLTIMGVAPPLQRRGIGTRLLDWSVLNLEGACDALFVVGHPDFYARAGFVEAADLGLSFPFPAPSPACRVRVSPGRALSPGVLSYHPVVCSFF